MNLNSLKKIFLISDTHMYLSRSATEAVSGNYSEEQIYESEFFQKKSQIFNYEEISKIKTQLNSKIPDLIIHAGDIGDQRIIDYLESIAKTVAVNGNCDFRSFNTFDGLTTDFEYLDFDNLKLVVAHRPDDLDSFINGSFLRPSKLDKNSKKPNLKIHGHTHKSHITITDENEACICPGSATQGRYGSPNSVAVIYTYKGQMILAELIEV